MMHHVGCQEQNDPREDTGLGRRIVAEMAQYTMIFEERKKGGKGKSIKK